VGFYREAVMQHSLGLLALGCHAEGRALPVRRSSGNVGKGGKGAPEDCVLRMLSPFTFLLTSYFLVNSAQLQPA
jgi:hypothetical protein